ncbi:MAG: choice-of-anchor tandem repeat GloVer-containing protein [Terriglobales bacterium]
MKTPILAFAILCALVAAIAQPAHSQTESVLYTFCSLPECADGSVPEGLILDAQGNLYGVTNSGGAHCCGTLFELSPTGTEAVLHSFGGGVNAKPQGLIQDAKGNLYGATAGVGLSHRDVYYGSVFELKKRSFKHLYVFTGDKNESRGAVPQRGMIMDARGNLYGTTFEGGTHQNAGTVFRLTPSGAEKVLYSFTGFPDGGWPNDGLVQDSRGNFYGTTSEGGDLSKCPNGCGVVFELSPDGTETVLHAFEAGLDGAIPIAGLTIDSLGNLYGTTDSGGAGCWATGGCGTVFKIDPNGNETVLYSFTGGMDGSEPYSRVVLDAQGNLYGNTYLGGGSGSCYFGCGTVFRLTPAGQETVLYRFSGGADGAAPSADLIMDASGNLYGTTTGGGQSGDCSADLPGCGVVFKLTP